MVMIEIKNVAPSKRKRKSRKKIAGLFWKVLIVVVVVHGMSCVTMSYILAFTYHTDVVETVSSTVISEIIAPVCAGLLSKVIENIFEKNELIFSKPIAKVKEPEDKEEEESVG